MAGTCADDSKAALSVLGSKSPISASTQDTRLGIPTDHLDEGKSYAAQRTSCGPCRSPRMRMLRSSTGLLSSGACSYCPESPNLLSILCKQARRVMTGLEQMKSIACGAMLRLAAHHAEQTCGGL